MPSKKLIPVVPGQRICKCDDQHVSGVGTFVRQGTIYSCSLGNLFITKKEDETFLVEVVRGNEQSMVPSAGCVVTVKVDSINPRFCKCSIVCIEGAVLKETFRGQIRKEDVRATEKDRIEMYKCFRPGDILLARVLSLGDAHSYLLSTAEDELGVAVANSESGHQLVPISWTEMQCPKTFNVEFRKVAKVVPENWTN